MKTGNNRVQRHSKQNIFNWRRLVIRGLLAASGDPTMGILASLRSAEYLPMRKLEQMQRQKLIDILKHAQKYVPYYHELFRSYGITAPEEITINLLTKLPGLTKDTIRENWEDLQSADPKRKQRKPYRNTSGGSTGKPVEFIQDKHYDAWNVAHKLYTKTFGNQEFGDTELRLWVSERDIVASNDPVHKRFNNWLFNRTDLSTIHVTQQLMNAHIQKINEVKPAWMETCVQSAYEVARHANETGQKVHSPKGVQACAGTLYPHARIEIERAFGCKVFNRYGSREVGSVACGCGEKENLHLMLLNSFVEILDENMVPVEPGIPGNLFITTLNNYSMPLIRYGIGDIATPSASQCVCGRGWPILKSVEGREVCFFKRRDGSKIDGLYFIRFFFQRSWCDQFQVIQNDYDLFNISVVVREGQQSEFIAAQPELARNFEKAMGGQCQFHFNIVDDIPVLPSGKRVYTFSKIAASNHTFQ